MKILKKVITADTQTKSNMGTTFYTVTMDQMINAFDSDDMNIWIRKSFEEIGWDAIDFRGNLFGSRVIDNTLYICVSDGYDIEVDGDSVNPEEVLEQYPLNVLSEYIKQSTNTIIRRYITEYEIKTPEFSKWAIDLLKDGEEFSTLVRDFQSFS